MTTKSHLDQPTNLKGGALTPGIDPVLDVVAIRVQADFKILAFRTSIFFKESLSHCQNIPYIGKKIEGE